MADPWGNIPVTPVKSSGDNTAGNKGKIIMSSNQNTHPGKPASSGGSRNTNGNGWGN